MEPLKAFGREIPITPGNLVFYIGTGHIVGNQLGFALFFGMFVILGVPIVTLGLFLYLPASLVFYPAAWPMKLVDGIFTWICGLGALAAMIGPILIDLYVRVRLGNQDEHVSNRLLYRPHLLHPVLVALLDGIHLRVHPHDAERTADRTRPPSSGLCGRKGICSLSPRRPICSGGLPHRTNSRAVLSGIDRFH